MELRTILAATATLGALWTGGPALAKGCDTTIKFRTTTSGKTLNLYTIETKVRGNLFGKSHSVNYKVKDNTALAVKLKLAQICNLRRKIILHAKKSDGISACAYGDVKGKGVMDFGTLDFGPCLNSTFGTDGPY